MKSKEFKPEEWIKRAYSNLEKIKTLKKNKKILLEDICFEAQQATEKALKGLLIYFKGEYVKTHSIRELIVLIEKNNVQFPEEMKEAFKLSYYASETRYPGDYDEITKEDLKEATRLAKKVVKWSETIISEKNPLFK